MSVKESFIGRVVTAKGKAGLSGEMINRAEAVLAAEDVEEVFTDVPEICISSPSAEVKWRAVPSTLIDSGEPRM